ncbi:MAG: DUF4062 domain-containing protein, partial [Desulfobacterales bacterium]|nr:DUF4062 domain-containing protein [Desulfobacterales bacterium]
MKSKLELSVFIASPGDVGEEREIAREACEDLSGKPLMRDTLGLSLLATGWEDVFPSPGRPQEIINSLVRECDIFICIFHKRFGSPTGKSGSGTLEEFLLAYESWKKLEKPHIMFYFKRAMVSGLRDLEDPQLQKVFKLKESIQKNRRLLYTGFANPDDFREKLTGHLEGWVAKNAHGLKHPPPGTDGVAADAPPHIPLAYRKWLIDHCRFMDIDKLRERGRVIQVNLPEIFIPLYAHRPGSSSEEDPRGPEAALRENERPVNIETLASEREYLLIEGLAGSGKTTLLKHFAHTIMQAGDALGMNGFLPILVFLKDLQTLNYRVGEIRAAASFSEKILADYFQLTENGLDLETVKAYLGAGKAVILLDGLDEIGPGLRDIVANSFADFKIKYETARIALSGRSHGMDGAVIDRFGDGHVKIQPLDMEQIETFISGWFRHVFARESDVGRKTARDMIGEIKAHPGIGRLTDNPLMLTAICILYHDGKALPGQRAELYKKFVANLLYRRFQKPERVQNFLMTLAHRMHTERVRGIDRSRVIEVLGSIYTREENESVQDHGRRLEKLFDAIEPDSGLLTLTDGQYNFRHLMFQEFLTAAAIVDNERDYEKAISIYWEDPWFAEVVALFIGYLSIENRRWAND